MRNILILILLLVFPDQGHSVPEKWYRIRMDFFKEKLGMK
jgi:hypothetical protein